MCYYRTIGHVDLREGSVVKAYMGNARIYTSDGITQDNKRISRKTKRFYRVTGRWKVVRKLFNVRYKGYLIYIL